MTPTPHDRSAEPPASNAGGWQDEPTWERGEGPTPAGGAYYVAQFSLDGRPVPRRFANRIEIQEYDGAGRSLKRTYATTTPDEALPHTSEPPFWRP